MSGTHGVFQHRTGYFYTILEEDFCEVYKAPGANEVCRAYITSILEHLTNKQFEATGRDNDIWVFMSLPEMERRMRHACSQRTIHKELQSMAKEGFLFKRRAIGKATMEYKLNLRKLRKALEALPEVQSSNSARYNLAELLDQSSNSARLILQNDKNDLANLQPRIHREEERDYTEITEESALVAASSQSNEHAHALEHENNNYSYRHDHTRKEDAWRCENWCRAHEKTCSDYQTWIESGGRETPTEPRVEAIPKGATDATLATNPADRDRSRGRTPADNTDRSHGVPDDLHPGGSVRRDGVELEAPQSPALRAAGSPQTVAIASTPGRAAAPPAATDPHSLQGPIDGAATDGGSESRASGKRSVHLSAHEAEMRAWLEELRGTELDLARRDITAIRSLGKKKGSDDKEMFLNVVAVLDIDPWFEEHSVAVDFYWIDYWWQNKYMFLQRKKPKAALDDGERHSDFDIYKGNGPEARKKWREEGARLKALGYSPDL